MKAGSFFPRYGGMAVFTVPPWYGENTVPVFNQETSCSSPNLHIDQQTTDPDNFVYRMSIQAYTEVDQITIMCSNYNNPVFRRETTGFQLQIFDNERLGNTVIKSASWSFDKSQPEDLISRSVEEINFEFYLNRNTTPEESVEIQKQAGLEISFEMPIPVEVSSEGYFLMIQFPKDFSLPDPGNDELALVYQSVENSMMVDSEGSVNLDSGIEVDSSR